MNLSKESLQLDLKSTPFVFVYGTLKKGLSNHRLIEGAEFVTNGRVKSFGTLNNTYPPTFTADFGDEIPVSGEMYKVDEETMLSLDSLEGHPYGYFRTQVDVETDEGSNRAWCYFYYVDGVEDPAPVINGCYEWK